MKPKTELLKKHCRRTDNDLLMSVNVDSWDMIFKIWVESGQAAGERKLMIIDEGHTELAMQKIRKDLILIS